MVATLNPTADNFFTSLSVKFICCISLRCQGWPKVWGTSLCHVTAMFSNEVLGHATKDYQIIYRACRQRAITIQDHSLFQTQIYMYMWSQPAVSGSQLMLLTLSENFEQMMTFMNE